MASVKVAVRVRPFNQRELDLESNLIIQMNGKKTSIYNAKRETKDFTFDHSYWSFDTNDKHFSSQEQVFEDLGVEVVDSAFHGYNACVFAYGQTGSGKTFTMMGSPENQGLIPRICKSMFERMHVGRGSGASYRTEVSYLEIYNEKVKDLLQEDDSHSLRVREHPSLGPYVQGLSKHLVSDYQDIQRWMQLGNTHRTTARTNMNDTSSRSHAIFTVTFVQAEFSADHPTETVSKVHLVDLAGSERADATGATGERLKEGAHINKSLVTLGLVISTLAKVAPDKRTSSFIPYRDSVLTWLLKDSLGGNSKTIMIAAISPADVNYEETLSTLRYANRAKNIINKPTVNEDANVALIRTLREEINKLKEMLGASQVEGPVLAQLLQKEAREKELTEEWTEKWRETRAILEEQSALGLRKSGVGVVLDSDRPHLVGIDDDLRSTGVTFYHLKDGETLIGTEDCNRQQDIVLTGGGIEPEHCSIVIADGQAWLHPRPSATCWVNTVPVDKPVRLSQGCIIMLGRTNMFRFNDPVEAAVIRKTGSLSHLNQSTLSLVYSSTTDLAERTFSSENLLDDSRLFIEERDNPVMLQSSPRDSVLSENGNGKKPNWEGSLKNLTNTNEPDALLNKELADPSDVESSKTVKERKEALSLDLPSPTAWEKQGQDDSGIGSGQTDVMGQNGVIVETDEGSGKESQENGSECSTSRDLPRPSVSDSSEEEWVRGRIRRLPRGRSFSKSCRNLYDNVNVGEAMRAMKLLCQKVAEQKLLIIQSLENDCGKEEMNAQIAELQELHRQYVRIEAILELKKDSEFNRNHTPDSPMLVTGVRNTMTRSMPSLRPANEEWAPWLRIPGFVLRGVGRQARYEYELRLHTEDESWVILRRYKRFRDLHMSMCAAYGEQVEALRFPSRQWMPWLQESVARTRRQQLETYLLQLIAVCSRIRTCPLFGSGETPSRQQLIQFSSFFRKGLFEPGKSGTS